MYMRPSVPFGRHGTYNRQLDISNRKKTISEGIQDLGMKLNGVKILSIGFFLFGLIACHEEPINIDYCKMISEDQTYVNTDKSDMVKFKADKEVRHKIFEKNFELIMEKTKQDGFPFVSLNNYPKDSCKYWAVSMTMIHTAQSNPNLFFSKKYANLFKREMDKGNIEKKLLEEPSIITAKTIDLCVELRPDIEYAVKLWGIKLDIFDEANFIECR